MKCEGAAMAQLAFHRETTAHGLGNTSRQRQSQTGSVDLCRSDRLAAIERLKDLFDLRRLNAYSSILDADLNLSPAVAGIAQASSDPDPPAVSTIFHRVADQVLQALRQCRQVSANFWQIGLDCTFQPESCYLNKAGGIVERGIHYFRDSQPAEGVTISTLLRGGKQQYLLN